MDFNFERQSLDGFFTTEYGRSLDDFLAISNLYDTAQAAQQLAECDCLGTDYLNKDERRCRLLQFFCFGIILEATLHDDAKRRALATVHSSSVSIGGAVASSYHEAVWKLASIRIIHFESDSGSSPQTFSDLREGGFRVAGGFFGKPTMASRLSEVQAELEREADIASAGDDVFKEPEPSKTRWGQLKTAIKHWTGNVDDPGERQKIFDYYNENFADKPTSWNPDKKHPKLASLKKLAPRQNLWAVHRRSLCFTLVFSLFSGVSRYY